jgi:hypothetical protein
LPRYALHNTIMGCDMYYINYGSLDYG